MAAVIGDLVPIRVKKTKFSSQVQAVLYWTGLRYPDAFEKIKMETGPRSQWYYISLEPSELQRKLDRKSLERFIEERYPVGSTDDWCPP